MKIFFITVLYISSFVCFSQQKNVSVEVGYLEFMNVTFLNTYGRAYATLSANNTTSVYKAYVTEVLEGESFDRNDSRLSDVSKMEFYDNYLKTDLLNKKLLFFETLINNKVLVEDIYPNLKWQITQESKIVGSYNCIKATVSYRGRDWTAWFAPEIPLAVGPWKLHGLPGLILEAYDATNECTYKAVNIAFKDNNLLHNDFTKLVKTKNKKPMTYRQFLQDRREALDNIYKKIDQEDTSSKFADVKVPRFGLELKYEWEE
ncbi:MAG: GLPGLI family protein [Bacteroidia bacterium]